MNGLPMSSSPLPTPADPTTRWLPAPRGRIDELWREGMCALANDDLAGAAAAWTSVLELDGSCADALLGLHRISGEIAVLERLLGCRHRLGALADYADIPQASSVDVVPGVHFTIVDAADVCRAMVIERLRAGDLTEVATLCATAAAEDPQGAIDAYLQGLHALTRGHGHTAVRLVQPFVTDIGIGSACALVLADALVLLECPNAALACLDDLANRPVHRATRLWARYRRAALLEDRDPEAARVERELIYAQDVAFLDNAERLFGPNADTWELLVSALESVPPASDDSHSSTAI